MQKQDRNYYTHAKYGPVFFISLALLIIIVAVSLVSVFTSDDTAYHAETALLPADGGLPETGELWHLCDEIKDAGTLSGGGIQEEYPALYGLITGEYGEIYTDTGGGYVCIAGSYTKRLSRYVNTEVILMPCSGAVQDGEDGGGTVSVELGDPSYMTLRYNKKEDTLSYLITSGTDSRVKPGFIQVELDSSSAGGGIESLAYTVRTVRGASDTERRDNKFQQFVSLYSGEANRIIMQEPAEYGDDTLGGFDGMSGSLGSRAGVIFDLTGDLYTVYGGAGVTADFAGGTPGYRIVIDRNN